MTIFFSSEARFKHGMHLLWKFWNTDNTRQHKTFHLRTCKDYPKASFCTGILTSHCYRKQMLHVYLSPQRPHMAFLRMALVAYVREQEGRLLYRENLFLSNPSVLVQSNGCNSTKIFPFHSTTSRHRSYHLWIYAAF